MPKRLMTFVDADQEAPDKRPAAQRAVDFHEIYAELIAAKADAQASRCSQCGVPFCQSHCPLGNHIPDWLKLTAEGRLEEAYALSASTNPMPEVCGRICPQDRLCEGNCVIEQSGHGSVTIGAVERYLTETAFAQGWVAPIRPPRERGTSVGIVGSGPAGLAAAEALRAKGHQVTIYERQDRAGGLLTYGIPDFKLEKHVVARRVERLVEAGVVFRLNCEIGRDVSLETLRSRHDAVLLAGGVYAPRALEVPLPQAEGLVPALAFLTAANRAGLGEGAPPPALSAAGKRVIVVGGGDTAMDCVRTAVRQGALSVSCLYRRDRANMPGSDREVANAEEEGVRFEWLAAPEVVRARKGVVSGVRVKRMRLTAPDAAGRRGVEAAPDEGVELKADMLILALGFEAEDFPALYDAPSLKVTRRGALRVDPRTQMTNLDGVFAAGDAVRGASLVVWALRDGLEAARAMHAYLKSRAAVDPARVAAE